MEHLTKDQIEENKYSRARKRIEQLKKFYKYVMIYVIVNVFISFFKIRNYMDNGDSFLEALLNFDTYIVWIIWGFFLLLQAVKTFKAYAFLGKNWEERKIKEYMDDR